MKKVVNVSIKTALFIFLLLFLSNKVYADTLEEMVAKTYPLVVTKRNYFNFSKDKNFIILLVDCIDSKRFNKELTKSKYKDNFKDFTYYPDTASYYLYTRESIPLILTGTPNYNEEDYKTYYNKAFDNSPLIDKLIEQNYDINIFDHELIWSTEKGNVVQNVDRLDAGTTVNNPLECKLKNLGDKYLHGVFVIFPWIKDINCNTVNEIDYNTVFSWDDIDNYHYFDNASVNLLDKKQFKFVHVNGAHRPYNIDGELNRVSETKASYETELNASIKFVSTYIDLLKQNNVYDNSVIIVMADHGFAFSERIGRQNPILFIKGVNEINTEMNVSDKKISHIDLMDAYMKLLEGNKSTDLFAEITADRVRTVIYYVFREEDHMVEYNLKGHAWENNTLVKTGKVYDRK